jgi:hypothetical protein
MDEVDTNDISNLSDIKPFIPNNILSIITDEFELLLDKISNDYGLDNEEIKKKYKADISKIGMKIGIKKRNRRVLPVELQCMGRKIDGLQCTRSKRPGKNYCLSHLKSLPYGSIDDNSYQTKQKGKRGRKKKVETYNSDEYIATHLEVINGIQYLIDDDENVYTYNIDKPKCLGKKDNFILLI